MTRRCSVWSRALFWSCTGTRTGLLTAKDFVAAALRYWIGDVIGIVVLAPFALFALTRRRILPMSMETALQCAAVVCALVLVFGIAEEREFQLFYVLFLPIVWMAVRNGIEGVSGGILVTQLGVILGARFLPNEREELIAFQALMLVLAVTGLIAGELVTERRRMESRLRLHQESIARLTRLGSIGELAAAVAHEDNQPLTAAGIYTRLVADMTSSRNADAAEVAEIAKKAVAQVDRAAEVIRRLRALVRLDRSNRVMCSIERLVKEAIELCQPSLDRANVTARLRQSGNLPPVMVDMLQIEQVLVNLMRNSIEAIGDSGSTQGTIRIEAKPADREICRSLRRRLGSGICTRANRKRIPSSIFKQSRRSWHRIAALQIDRGGPWRPSVVGCNFAWGVNPPYVTDRNEVRACLIRFT